MGRRFSDSIKSEAIGRQNGRCGDCGVDLRDTSIIYDFHHMKRYADGGSNKLENCVVLCDMCHYAIHNYGNYRQPIQFAPNQFPYLNG